MMRGTFPAILLTVLLGWGTPPSTQAQQGWLIYPGQSWGPLSLGMSEIDAISAVGKPPLEHKVFSPGEFEILHYSTFDLFFAKSATDDALKLTSLNIYNPQAETREGIRLGSSIHKVVQLYGDFVQAALEGPRSPDRAAKLPPCLRVKVNALYRNGIRNYRLLFLDLEYTGKGIGFGFSPMVASEIDSVNVTRIDVKVKEECSPLPF